MENRVFLGLGSNIGDSKKYIEASISKIGKNENILIENVSSLYSTKPWGGIEQNNYLNAVLLIKTDLAPDALLEFLKLIEREVGRNETVRWGPREIDIDILLYGERKIESEQLSIPHKHLLNRDFFYIPILEIEPLTKLPDGKKLEEVTNEENESYIIDKFEFKI